MKKSTLASILALSLITINTGFASSNFAFEQTQVQPVQSAQYVQQPLQYSKTSTLHGNVVMVPAGSSVKVMLTAPISSEFTTAGQTVSMALNDDFYYDNKLIAPAGSTVYGTVIEASKAKRGSINGKLCIRFTQIYTPYGTQIPISAVIKTNDNTGVLVGGTKLDVTKEYAKDLAAGSAAGALSGLVFGALAGGDVGRGAALGTAVGAGGGLVKSVWDKGQDVVIPANAAIELVFTQPITTTASPYGHEN